MRLTVALLLLAVASAGCFQGFGQKIGLAPAPPDPYVMPDLADATIRPGVAIGPGGSEFCTANFLFLDEDGGTVYLGTAAHCVSESTEEGPLAATNTNGCEAVNLPLEPGRYQFAVAGATQMAVLAYNSWFTMQEVGEGSDTVCADNDFALLRLHPDDAARAHPQILGGTGPTGLANDVAPGDVVYSYGASTFAGRPDELRPRNGLVLSSSMWSHTAFFATPGVPGDSGSGVLRDDGAAVGILVTLNGLPPGTNGITDLQRAMDYAMEHTDLRFTLLTA